MQRFNPRHLIALADRLSQDIEEASLRSAVSRAYYGAFLTARDLLNIDTETAAVHAEAQRCLKHRGFPELARQLESLRRMRNAADYRLTSHLRASSALRAALESRKLVAKLDCPEVRKRLKKNKLKARATPSSPARSPRGRLGRAHR